MQSPQKKWLPILLLIILAVFLVPAPAAINETRWTRLMIAGYNFNDVRYYLAAVNLAEKYGSCDPRLHLAILSAAGGCRYSDPPLTEKLFKTDIANLEKLDVDFPDIVYDCYELARILESQGRYKEAEALLLRGLSIRQKWEDISSDSPFNAQLLACLFLIYYSRGETDKAAETKTKMLNAVEQIRNESTRGSCLSSVHWTIRTYVINRSLPPEQKTKLLGIALELSDRAIFYLRRSNSLYDLADQLVESAADELDLGNKKKSEQLARESLKIAYSDFENLGNVPWSSTQNMCWIICRDGRYKEAEQLQETYLRALAQQYGSKSPIYASRLGEISNFWANHYQTDLATKWKQREKVTKDWIKNHQPETHQ